jgi:SAM-dependent methyltransferase
LKSLLALIGKLHGRLVFARRVDVLAARIAPLLPPGPFVDVGCGDGTVARNIVRLRGDLTPAGLDVLVRDGAAIEVAAFDGRSIPLADGAKQAVLLVDVLHHADDPVALLRECGRVGGVVVVKDHLARSPLDHLTLSFMDWVGNRPHGVGLVYRYFTPESWSRALAEAGLTCEQLIPLRGLYPAPFSLLFERDLHFIARLRPAAGGRSGELDHQVSDAA